MASETKFYVTMVTECPHCDGVGTLFGEQCTDCRGTGTIEDAVELAAALVALGILTRLDAVEKTAGRAIQYADGLANGGI